MYKLNVSNIKGFETSQEMIEKFKIDNRSEIADQ